MSFQLIPLNQLVTSSANVRRTDRKVDLDALSASILAHGLLQNLSVQPRAENRFEVVAGGRRLCALKALAKAGKIARDFAVPCNLVDPDGAAETSLAENVQRVAMNAMDEADAFQALREQDLSPDDISRRFGVTTRHVEQRLALASLSPKIKAAFRRDELNLDAARAFCIEPDHGKQDAAFRALGKPVTHAGQVRTLLTEGSLKASDRLVRFVGLEAYENAGGALTRDLFDPDTVFIAEPTLITQLADQRMEAIQAELTAQGWGWVDAACTHSGMSSHGGQRIHPTRRAMTRAERKSLAALDTEIAALDTKLDNSEEDDDTAWQTHEELDTQRQALVEKTQEWDEGLIAHAGVIVRLDYEGSPTFTYGIVAKADQPKLKRILADRSPEGPANPEETDAPSEAETIDVGSKLPKTVARELTTARAAALRQELSASPEIALAVVVYACLQFTAHSHAVRGVNVRLDPVTMTDLPRFDADRSSLFAGLPEDGSELLDWCLAQGREPLLNALAVLTADALDLSHDAHSSQDRALQRIADKLASVLDLDMRRFWTADAAFFSRLSKAMLMDILEATPSISAKTGKRRETLLNAHAKLKRDDLAKAVSKAVKGSGWLPDLLVTPIGSGALSLHRRANRKSHL